MGNVQFRQAVRLYIVGAPNQGDVDKAHPDEKWDDAENHDLILGEEPFRAIISTGHANQNNDQGKAGTPPAHQKGRIVL